MIRFYERISYAEECESDTFLQAWNSIPPQRPTILSSFLAKITRNLSIDRLRRKNAQKRGGEYAAILNEPYTSVVINILYSPLEITTDRSDDTYTISYKYISVDNLNGLNDDGIANVALPSGLSYDSPYFGIKSIIVTSSAQNDDSSLRYQ